MIVYLHTVVCKIIELPSSFDFYRLFFFTDFTFSFQFYRQSLDSGVLSRYLLINTERAHLNREIGGRIEMKKWTSDNVGYLRSGFEYFLKGFAPFHFPAETTTFQVELEEIYRLWNR